MRIALIALVTLLVVHGAIHLLGFLKAWGLAALPQMRGRTIVPLGATATHVVGLLWLLAAVILLATAALRIANIEGWWIAGAVGLVVSQALVILAWPDAKAGTVANMILLVPVLVAGATARFDHQVADERSTLLADAVTMPASPVRAEELADLPAPVRRWLTRAGVVGRPRTSRVHLTQRGEMRTTPDGPWLPTTAEQDFSVEPPGFVWQVHTTMLRVLPIVGRDRYARGAGNMYISAAGLYPVVDASGPPIDQGSRLRFLGEIVWFPSAALSPRIRWTPIDDDSARATLVDGDEPVSADFHFDPQGRFVSLTAERAYSGDGTRQPWLVTASEWRPHSELEVPTAGEVLWRLPAGDFSYFRWQVDSLQIDP
ncbi:DUF6544 family protein [Nannocystis sp.]|uniref:DUF6544 family protein n=1 Tax=Nannocystis sp. TaxID=1962667 RepID=UPI0025EE42B7|nr:DUF6544 family protein [Nannocystis sp.]MBK7829326.1 hypothetical protein [Nannocystis sp.]